jgi:hypothetical protein
MFEEYEETKVDLEHFRLYLAKVRIVYHSKLYMHYIAMSIIVSWWECETVQAYTSKFIRNIHDSSTIYMSIDNSHYRLILKLDKEMQINHHSKKEHTKISKIAKFGCEML